MIECGITLFDTDCDGYPSKQAESAAIYKCAVINKYSEGTYQKKIDDILVGYDFERMWVWVCWSFKKIYKNSNWKLKGVF